MMCGFATFYGKHHIIATEGSNIIFAKQMHHIAAGDASFDKQPILWHNSGDRMCSYERKQTR
jgi:hypothetical protein